MVQDYTLENQLITVIYGHLKLTSITKKIGETIIKEETIRILGADESFETSNERKHLHLGLHKGSEINLLGYVPTKAELTKWIDTYLYLCD